MRNTCKEIFLKENIVFRLHAGETYSEVVSVAYLEVYLLLTLGEY